MRIKQLLKAIKYRPGSLYFVTLSVSVLIILIVITNLVEINRHEQEHILKNHFNAKTMQFLSDMYLNNLDQPEYKDDRVVGITVYKSDGTTVFNYGTLAEDPRLNSPDIYESLYFNEKKNLIFINYELNGFLDNIPDGRPKEFGNETMYNVIVHLEIKDELFFNKKFLLIIVQYGICIILFLIYLSMLFTFRRSQKFKNELDSQKNLVILGTALRTLAHEMKNPLAVIRLQSGYMRKLYPEDLKQETALIDSEVQRLSRLMELVRDYLKEPVGEAVIFNVADYLVELKNLFPPQLKWTFPDDNLCIYFDKDKFRSVIENLINNAIESNSPLSDISIECLSSRRSVFLNIRDKGVGIPPQIKNKLFDPFYTTKSKGSGVGLMIVKRFIEAAGGQLDINSIPDEVTLVEVRLPRRQEVKA